MVLSGMKVMGLSEAQAAALLDKKQVKDRVMLAAHHEVMQGIYREASCTNIMEEWRAKQGHWD